MIFRGRSINDEFKRPFSWHKALQFCRLFAEQNLRYEFAGLLVGFFYTWSIADQAAILGKLAPLIDSWNLAIGRRSNHFLAVVIEKRICRDNHPEEAFVAEILKRPFDSFFS